MKVLIADNLDVSAVTLLADSGFQVPFSRSLKMNPSYQRSKVYNPRYSLSAPLRSPRCVKPLNLELIIRAGAGVNNIDLESASQNAICVSNCPGMNAVAVAELTLAHLLNADRKLYENIHQAREGHWAKKSLSPGRGVKGTRLGILGFGAIGKAVAVRARALEMEVVAWSNTMTDEVN